MSETKSYPYATFLDIKFPALTLVDVPSLVKACKDKWYNQTLCKVNDSVVRLGVMQGEYHWHKHDELDEFFFVLEGRDGAGVAVSNALAVKHGLVTILQRHLGGLDSKAIIEASGSTRARRFLVWQKPGRPMPRTEVR